MDCRPLDLCPWDFPGKNTGVGCRFLLQGSSRPRNLTWVSCIAGGFFTNWTTLWSLKVLFWLIYLGAFKKSLTLNLTAWNQCHVLGCKALWIAPCPFQGTPCWPKASSPAPGVDRCPGLHSAYRRSSLLPSRKPLPYSSLSARVWLPPPAERHGHHGGGGWLWRPVRWPRVTSGARSSVRRRVQDPSQERDISSKR